MKTVLALTAALALAIPGAALAQNYQQAYLPRPDRPDARYSDARSHDRLFGLGVAAPDPVAADSEDGYATGPSPYVARSYTAALEQGYDTGAQVHEGAAPVHDDAATGYAARYEAGAAGGQACGQWAWEPVMGRYAGPC
jgi:hypothetical protein